MIEIENRATLEEYLKTGINLFLGSAFSILSKGYFNEKLCSLPTGSELLNEIKHKFGKENSKLALPQLCQTISSTKKGELNDFFQNRFDVKSFDDRYYEIQFLNIKSIFTTNIDNLIYKIYENSNVGYINDLNVRGASIVNASSIDYIALHGSITHDPNDGFDFTPIEISTSFERDKDKWYQYRHKISTVPTIYWGYSLSDSSVLQAISKNNDSTINRNAWILIRDADDEDSKEYFKSLGFNIIVADTNKMLDYIKDFNEKNRSISFYNESLVEHTKLFKFDEYLLPQPGKTRVRKRESFYLGDEPIWFDIYSGHIHRTEHFFTIKDFIISNKNVIIIGGAITGKTTLLKQLSYEFSSKTNCLFIREITPEKASVLMRYISKENIYAIVFIDNAADSWESINLLLRSTNIKIVCAERDYIFDSISHKFDGNKFEILDVSGINDRDKQSIEKAFPFSSKKKSPLKPPKLHLKNTEPTIYDVMSEYGIKEIITTRFSDAISELEIENITKYKLLLLACYSYHCRIPVSLDMALSFLSDNHYSDILSALKNMSSLISDYNGDLSDNLQMYFTPRSRIAAEDIMKTISSSQLHYLLEHFHENVSKINIPRYDIFKRFAFDANITFKAYPSFEDGQNFYKRFIHRDESHSYCQQAALYCLRKHKYTEAFEWIDKALSIARGYAIQTIRNTYAVILFSANYSIIKFNKNKSTEFILSLDESMEILIECYNTDVKKTYHSKVFAEQAIKYSDVINDNEKSLNYINIAIEWINSELSKIPNKRNLQSILRKLKAIKNQSKFR